MRRALQSLEFSTGQMLKSKQADNPATGNAEQRKDGFVMGLSPGKQFEKDFKDSIPDRCDVTRLKDSGGWNSGVGTNQRFASTNPCDFIIFSQKRECFGDDTSLTTRNTYKLELKSCKGKSLPYGNIKPKNHKGSAKENSIKFTEVLVESQEKGIQAGFIVNFRTTNQTFWVLADLVLEHLEFEDRSSIPTAWFEEYGTLIKQTLKIKHYRYDLEWL